MTSLDTDTNFRVKYSTEQRNLTKPQNEVLLYFRIDSKRCPQSVEPDHRSDYNTHPHFHTALLSTLDDKWTLHFRAGLFHPEAAPCCALNKAHQFTACEQMTQVIVILQGKLGGVEGRTPLFMWLVRARSVGNTARGQQIPSSFFSRHYITTAFVIVVTKKAVFNTRQRFDLLKAQTAGLDGLCLQTQNIEKLEWLQQETLDHIRSWGYFNNEPCTGLTEHVV